jgi:hypothetical protein
MSIRDDTEGVNRRTPPVEVRRSRPAGLEDGKMTGGVLLCYLKGGGKAVTATYYQLTSTLTLKRLRNARAVQLWFE